MLYRTTRHDTHHVLIRWQIHPDWGDSWPWEHARFRSTSCDGGNAQRVHGQGSLAHTYNPLHGTHGEAHAQRTRTSLTDTRLGQRGCSVKGSSSRRSRRVATYGTVCHGQKVWQGVQRVRKSSYEIYDTWGRKGTRYSSPRSSLDHLLDCSRI